MGEQPDIGDLLRWSESLAGIARTGLGFTKSLYEQERYEEVLRVAADIRVAADELQWRSSAGTPRPSQPASGGVSGSRVGPPDAGKGAAGGTPRARAASGLVQEWLRGVGEGVPGYVTPKVAVGAAVGNDAGELLLVRRADSGAWLYPTGWADVGYSAAEIAVKEVAEETGMEVEPVRLIALLDGLRLGFTMVPLYSVVFQCRVTGGSLKPHPLECSDVGWFAEDDLPEPLAGADRWRERVFAALRGESVEILFDTPRSPLWRGDPEAV